jgi:hypothetical protein
MTKPLSSIYTVAHSQIRRKLVHRIDRGISNSQTKPILFFRADDVGIPSHSFHQLILSFHKHNLPLCLATVPTWLTPKRLHELSMYMDSGSSQWCWHLHGWLHRNFEVSGKKQEFGPARNPGTISDILHKGRTRLETLLEENFHPVFTPPWNRCSQATLTSLVNLRFKAVSRSTGASPEAPSALPDFQVNVDLHTRKEISPERGLENLMAELERGIASGQCGIMIHHQRMNKHALHFLDLLLEIVGQNQRVDTLHFNDMTGSLSQ